MTMALAEFEGLYLGSAQGLARYLPIPGLHYELCRKTYEALDGTNPRNPAAVHRLMVEVATSQFSEPVHETERVAKLLHGADLEKQSLAAWAAEK